MKLLGKVIPASVLLSGILAIGCTTTEEHAGKEAEHAGKKAEEMKAGANAKVDGAKKEHAGKDAEHAGKKAKKKKKKKKKKKMKKSMKKSSDGASLMNRKIYADDIKKAMNKHIAKNTVNGIYSIADIKTTDKLKLEFVKIHDPVRAIEGRGYFACTDFHPEGEAAGKLYDLDFWLKMDDRGELKITEVAIHKHPEQKKSGKWEKVARYTFVNDVPVEVR